MTDNGVRPATEAELNAELKTLIRHAHENGIEVRGGWPCRNGTGHPDWDVVVTEVEKPGNAE
jgi:hypothetical protein